VVQPFFANDEGAVTDSATTIMSATVSIKMMRFIFCVSFFIPTQRL